MLVFPQLASGALGVYPIRKRLVIRTLENVLVDGGRIRYADIHERWVRWDLPYEGLTDVERASLQGMFDEAQGRLRDFLFLDPADNLLSDSTYQRPQLWAKDPQLSVAAGEEEVWGGGRALYLENAGGTAQVLGQYLHVPGWFTYCVSAYLKDVSFGGARLIGECGTESQGSLVEGGGGWRRYNTTIRCRQPGMGVRFGVEVPPGGAIALCGLSVEAQPYPSPLRITQGTGGVYARARFDTDRLVFRTNGPNDHSCHVEVICRAND
jgi:hypothetical protein